jgi:hypothetical protein
MDNAPSRTLHLSTPYTKGEDVRRLQVAIDARGRAPKVKADSEYGPATAHSAKVTALALGIATGGIANGLGKRAQTIIRNPRLRTPVELYRARARAKAAARRASSGAAGTVRLALELAHRTPHITEQPAGSNRGPLIDQMQREVDMIAQPWCGAFAHWCLKHGGGIDVTHEVRYCPATEAHAKNGTGGFARWVPAARAHEAPVGSLILYGSQQADHVEILCSKSDGATVHAAGGNTSSNDGQSQANGGGAFERHRPIGGGFPVRGFAVPRGI